MNELMEDLATQVKQGHNHTTDGMVKQQAPGKHKENMHFIQRENWILNTKNKPPMNLSTLVHSFCHPSVDRGPHCPVLSQ